LAELQPALHRRILRRALERVGGQGRYDFQHVEALRRLVEQPRAGARISLPGLTAERSCGSIRLATGTAAGSEPVWIAPPDERQAPDGRTRIRIVPQAQDAGFGSYTKPNWDRIDWSKAPKPLLLRNWRPGDRIRLRTDAEPRKLSHLLQSSAVASWDRALWPVLAWAPNGDVSDDRIVWARGYGISSEFRPSGNIGEQLRVFEFDEGGRAWTGPESWEAISAGLLGR